MAKQEFKNCRQRSDEDVSTFLSTKLALHEAAYEQGARNFDNLLDSVIEGLYNKIVKLQLRRANPRNEMSLREQLVQIVANERSAYEAGYSQSATRDGLNHTTLMMRRENGPQEDERMDTSSMKKMISKLEEQIGALNTGTGTRPRDMSKVKCYKCGKLGHMAAKCYVKGTTTTGQRGQGGFKKGTFPFNCDHCGKKGHKKVDCYKWKNKQKDPKGKLRHLDGETEETDDSQSTDSRLLDNKGETEEN